MQTSEQPRQKEALGQLTRLYNVLQNCTLLLSHCCILPFGWLPGFWISGLTFQITVPFSWVIETTYKDGMDRVFQNVGTENSDGGESPKRKNSTSTKWRKFKIKLSHCCFDRCLRWIVQQAVTFMLLKWTSIHLIMMEFSHWQSEVMYSSLALGTCASKSGISQSRSLFRFVWMIRHLIKNILSSPHLCVSLL